MILDEIKTLFSIKKKKQKNVIFFGTIKKFTAEKRYIKPAKLVFVLLQSFLG